MFPQPKRDGSVFRIWTSYADDIDILDPHLEIRKTPGRKYRVYLIATNVKANKSIWCVAGPGSTERPDLADKWARYDVQKQGLFKDIEDAREYARTLTLLAPLRETIGLYSGLQPGNPPEFVELVGDDAVVDDDFDKAAALDEERAALGQRGGFEPPQTRSIPMSPPMPSTRVGPALKDPEARRVAMERRNRAHHTVLRALADRAEAAKAKCVCTQYADALCDESIFEVKSVEDHDEVAQVRAAIGQLYHYLFIHRDLPGFRYAELFAVFDRPISPSLQTFLSDRARIGVIIFADGRFHSDDRTMERLPWLFH
jgi:hypothetical protein